MLKIEHLYKKYLNSDRYSAQDINFEVHEGDLFGFLGQNGAGKSTTIKCMVGIYPFDSGDITICGHSIKTDAVKAKMNIGYVPDNHSVYEKLTGREYVNYIADLYGVDEATRNAVMDRFLKIFRLEKAVDRQIKGYSHGMKQKICLIASLIHRPKLWILDEPMTGLDIMITKKLIDKMKEYKSEGNSIFLTSHNIDLVGKLCDRVAVVNSGKIMDVVDLENRTDMEEIEEIFLRLTEVVK